MTTQLLVRLPEELVRRLRRTIPARQRSTFVRDAIEHALAPAADDDDPLYQAALAVEADERLTAEMADWEVTVGDGIAEGPLAEPGR